MERLCLFYFASPLSDYPLSPLARSLSLSPAPSTPRVHRGGRSHLISRCHADYCPLIIKPPPPQDSVEPPVRLIKPKGTGRTGHTTRERGREVEMLKPNPPFLLFQTHVRKRQLILTSFPRFSSSPCLLAIFFHFPLRRVSSRFT